MKLKIRTILAIIWTIFLLPSMAYAIFIDKHYSNKNEFQATTLETHIETDRGTTTIKEKINPEGKITFVVLIQNIGEIDTLNSMHIAKIDNEKFASLIHTQVFLDYSNLIYEGPLNEFKLDEYAKHPTNYGNKLQFILTISKDNYNDTPEKTLNLVIQNHAWDMELKPSEGFFDNEYLNITIEKE